MLLRSLLSGLKALSGSVLSAAAGRAGTLALPANASAAAAAASTIPVALPRGLATLCSSSSSLGSLAGTRCSARLGSMASQAVLGSSSGGSMLTAEVLAGARATRSAAQHQLLQQRPRTTSSHLKVKFAGGKIKSYRRVFLFVPWPSNPTSHALQSCAVSVSACPASFTLPTGLHSRPRPEWICSQSAMCPPHFLVPFSWTLAASSFVCCSNAASPRIVQRCSQRPHCALTQPGPAPPLPRSSYKSRFRITGSGKVLYARPGHVHKRFSKSKRQVGSAGLEV